MYLWYLRGRTQEVDLLHACAQVERDLTRMYAFPTAAIPLVTVKCMLIQQWERG